MALLRRRSFEAALATRLFFLGFRVDLTRNLDGDLSGEDEMKDTRSITFALNRIVGSVCFCGLEASNDFQAYFIMIVWPSQGRAGFVLRGRMS
jgi:hypothetical protein